MKQLVQIRNIFIVCLVFSLSACSFLNSDIPDIPSNSVKPTAQLVSYQEQEFIGFIHFTMNTFTGKEWGYGDEDPKLFNPTALDVAQWVTTAKNAGMKQLILTAKHHDGFCLWPSAYTAHSIKNSPYLNGNGDIVREFIEACKAQGIKAGLYVSPWDRNQKDYGTPAYIDYYKNQLKELLSNYGEINEIWFDGANGGDGYYGGANERRNIESKSYYGWESIFALVKELQPNIKIFSDAGPDVHWIGNENGFAGETFWSTINKDAIVIGKSDASYLNSGDSKGKNWIVGQCDVSIRPGWFYHPEEDHKVKSPQQLMDIFYKSVGRNAILLLNLPPNQEGIIHPNDVKVLQEFKRIREQTFAVDLAQKASATASNYRGKYAKFHPINVLKESAYWATDATVLSSDLFLDFKEPQSFNRILLQEPIEFGQRIESFELATFNPATSEWTTIFKGTTIGYKRILRVAQQKTMKLRLRITKANNSIAISKLGLFKATDQELSQNNKEYYEN